MRRWEPDPALDFLLDGTLPAWEIEVEEQHRQDAIQDRQMDMYNPCPYPLADWYALGAARVGIPRDLSPGSPIADASPGVSDQTLKETP